MTESCNMYCQLCGTRVQIVSNNPKMSCPSCNSGQLGLFPPKHIAEKSYITKDSGQREQHSTGAVRDVRTGKGRYDLISPLALKRIAGVYERGAVKYGDNNWTKGMPISRFVDSALRHVFNYLEGMRDEDHLAQAAWNLMAAIHMEEVVDRGLLPKEIMDTKSYVENDSV